jgi:hypothetical protein
MAFKKFKLDQLSTTALGVIAPNLETLQHIRQNSRCFGQSVFGQIVLTHWTSFGIFVQMLSNTRPAEIMFIWALDWIFQDIAANRTQ